MFSNKISLSIVTKIPNCIAYSFVCTSVLLLQILLKERVRKNTRDFGLLIWFLSCAYMCPIYTYVCSQFLIYLGYYYYFNYIAEFYVPSFLITNSYLYNSYINKKLLILVCTAFSLIASVYLMLYLIKLFYQQTYQNNYNDTKIKINPTIIFDIYIAFQTISLVVFALGLYFLHSFSMQLSQPEQLVSFDVIQKCLLIVCCIILSAISYFYNIDRSILVMSTDKDNQGIIIHGLASVCLLFVVLQFKYN